MSRTLILALLLLATGTAVAASPFAAYNGEQLYRRFCASCHGAAGSGDGPVAKSFRATLPDLTRIAQRHGGQFPEDLVRRVIDGRQIVGAHGDRLMPVWGQELRSDAAADLDPRDAETIVERLVTYLRSIQR
jgi:mono/diheme cytochrome c family protein